MLVLDEDAIKEFVFGVGVVWAGQSMITLNQNSW